MTVELTYLTYAVVLLFVHMFVQASFSDLSKGILWAIGPQDEPREQNIVAGRIQRALTNYVYNLFCVCCPCSNPKSDRTRDRRHSIGRSSLVLGSRCLCTCIRFGNSIFANPCVGRLIDRHPYDNFTAPRILVLP